MNECCWNAGEKVGVKRNDPREERGWCEVETPHGEKGLFPKECLQLSKAPLTDEQIPWALRWRIALDVAKGMNYLHSFQPPIVHRDLRSPNVFVRLSPPLATDEATCVRVQMVQLG